MYVLGARRFFCLFVVFENKHGEKKKRNHQQKKSERKKEEKRQQTTGGDDAQIISVIEDKQRLRSKVGRLCWPSPARRSVSCLCFVVVVVVGWSGCSNTICTSIE